MSQSAIWRGMMSINLFPNDREINVRMPMLTILSDEQAMQNDIEQVARDFWGVLSKEKNCQQHMTMKDRRTKG